MAATVHSAVGPWARALIIGVTSAALLPWTSPPAAGVSTGTAAPAAPAVEVAPGPVQLQLAVSSARAGENATVGVLALAAGAPAVGVQVLVQRVTGAGWTPFATLTTDGSGRGSVPAVLDRDPARNRFRVAVAGGPWTEVQAQLVVTPSRIALSAPGKVVDERRATLAVRWTTDRGAGVPGRVVVQRRVKKSGRWSGWSDFRTVRTDGAGVVRTQVRPRWSHRWRVVGQSQAWVAGARSGQATTKNVPPGKKVKAPRGAPRPRITMPGQRRATGSGANVEVSKIPSSVWRSMKGVSWRPGCPVGRRDLRLVETNYWAFDGYRRRGRVVVAASVVPNFKGAFRDLYAAKVPIRSMRLVDVFGRSKRLGGADDMRSMAADNTSVFNCRGVVGRPGTRSPHSWGRSFDLNPWENPFRSAWGVVPNRWWASREHPDVAWRSSRHRVVRILARNGFRWTYGHGDLHHFDAVPGAAATQRAKVLEQSLAATLRKCGPGVCD